MVGNDASQLDAVGMLTKYSIMLKKLPRIENEYIVGEWDFVTVQEVAKHVVEAVIGSTSGRFSKTTFINHCSKFKVPHEDLKAYLGDLSG